MMINKIRSILSGTSLTEIEFDKCTKELCDLFSVSLSLPSEESIESESESQGDSYSIDPPFADGFEGGFFAGANWMKDKIQKQ